MTTVTSENRTLLNLEVVRSTSLQHDLTLVVNSVTLDTTGYTGIMQVRETANSSHALAELTTANGGIEMVAGGIIRLNMTASTSKDIPVGEKSYNVIVTNASGFTFEAVYGKFTLLEGSSLIT